MKINDTEIWKDVLGYEGKYEVSTLGNVRRNGKLLKQLTNRQRGDYKLVGLCGKKHRVHRLVGQSFIDNPNNKPEINHINGLKWDNRVENLEWVTKKENVVHSVEIGLKGRKQLKLNQKFSSNIINEIKKLIDNKVKYRVISEKYNVSTGYITQLKKNNRRIYG